MMQTVSPPPAEEFLILHSIHLLHSKGDKDAYVNKKETIITALSTLHGNGSVIESFNLLLYQSIQSATTEIKQNDLNSQLDSRKQVIAFKDRVTTIHKGNSTSTKMRKINSRQIQYNVENFDEIHVLSASVRNRSSQ